MKNEPARGRRAPSRPTDPYGGDTTPRFHPQDLDSGVVAIPLQRLMNEGKDDALYDVVMDLNLAFEGGRDAAREQAISRMSQSMTSLGPVGGQRIRQTAPGAHSQYVFATLSAATIREFVLRDGLFGSDHPPPPARTSPPQASATRTVFHIWPDFKVYPLIDRSKSTVKADAAWAAYSAFGRDVTWAVLDSGIWGGHPHFVENENLRLDKPLTHMDFTGPDDPQPLEVPTDDFGHGTHVAGIIAGHRVGTEQSPILAYRKTRDGAGTDAIAFKAMTLDSISGMAPQCKLVSMKVLDGSGDGQVSNMIAALEYIQRLNDDGRHLLIHGVNLSVGYDFDPEWFASGRSPLCVEVDRLVHQGVVVVVAAGNSGYGYEQTAYRGVTGAGFAISINDPGNAELAITVGSTHRDMPHTYGVSYFSSKGPTADGRAKPDLVAPGEKILSCAAGASKANAERSVNGPCEYLEDSGTSMAAPHVSGAIAAFLSIRREYIGSPEAVKEIFTSNAIDLKRERSFQGSGLVDIMGSIQAV